MLTSFSSLRTPGRLSEKKTETKENSLISMITWIMPTLSDNILLFYL